MAWMKSPNFWVGVASVIAVCGLAVVVAGWCLGDQSVMKVGMWLLSPLIIGGVATVVVAVPVLILANRKLPPK